MNIFTILLLVSCVVIFGLYAACIITMFKSIKMDRNTWDEIRKEKLYMKAVNEDIVERFIISEDIIKNLNMSLYLRNTPNNTCK